MLQHIVLLANRWFQVVRSRTPHAPREVLCLERRSRLPSRGELVKKLVFERLLKSYMLRAFSLNGGPLTSNLSKRA